MLDENGDVWAGVGWGESRLLLTSVLFCHVQTWQGDIDTYQLLVASVGYVMLSDLPHSIIARLSMKTDFLSLVFAFLCYFLIEKHSSLMTSDPAEPCLCLQEKEQVVSFSLMSVLVP